MILDLLYETILSRKNLPAKDSYVSSLFAKGRDEILKKVGEEAVEVILAAKGQGRQALINELADLWFHTLVLAAGEGVSHTDIFEELQNRAALRRNER